MAGYRQDSNTALSSVTTKTTLDAYDATTDVILDMRTMREKALMVKNTHAANGLTYQVLGSLDDGATYDITVQADTAVVALAQSVFRNSEYYTHWKVRVRSTSAGNAATTTIKFAAAQ